MHVSGPISCAEAEAGMISIVNHLPNKEIYLSASIKTTLNYRIEVVPLSLRFGEVVLAFES